ncbi:MAG: hypothetical protein RQ891_04420 [Thermoflexus sp.]|uniref:hypothetical protein n=1 Tax=Thermoflexus sp. TaxID=1969742 RepID=UPI00262E9EB9|nr:hypothetical protein [Thermoflexus sp.]MDT7884086.1 hypothetical protein [Thermoflexus sp.]MDT7949106.1 hypothetical protein [Thermoflexus sp.]
MGFWKRSTASREAPLSPEARRQRLWERAMGRLRPTLPSDSPSWVLGEAFDVENALVWFDVVMRVGPGWVRRRYRYDGEVDVLYFSGEVPFPEGELDRLPPERMIWPTGSLLRPASASIEERPRLAGSQGEGYN